MAVGIDDTRVASSQSMEHVEAFLVGVDRHVSTELIASCDTCALDTDLAALALNRWFAAFIAQRDRRAS